MYWHLGFVPKLLLITGADPSGSRVYYYCGVIGSAAGLSIGRHFGSSSAANVESFPASIGEKAISWYSDTAHTQMNDKGISYDYVAIGI